MWINAAKTLILPGPKFLGQARAHPISGRAGPRKMSVHGTITLKMKITNNEQKKQNKRFLNVKRFMKWLYACKKRNNTSTECGKKILLRNGISRNEKSTSIFGTEFRNVTKMLGIPYKTERNEISLQPCSCLCMLSPLARDGLQREGGEKTEIWITLAERESNSMYLQ